jgi:PAS domain S-box-containing protein
MSNPLTAAAPGAASMRISPLARRLVAATIAASTVVALAATAFQLYLDYRRDLGQIDATFRQVGQTYLPTITHALWATNRHEVQVALDGLKQLPDVQYVAVREGASLWAEAGVRNAARVRSRDYPLTHRHRDRLLTIGTLSMTVNMDGVYQRLLEKFWIILLSNGVKTFLVAGFMFWLFHWFVTRHLQKIAGFAARLGSENLHQTLRLDRPRQKTPDEFDRVLEGFQVMQANLKAALEALKQDILARERVEEELRQLNAELEQRVADRTRLLQEQARIIDEIHDAVISIDMEGFLTSWNLGAERLFGYTAKQVLGRNSCVLFPDRQAVLDPQRIQDGQAFEAPVQRKNGDILFAHLSVSALHDAEKQVCGYACYALDISARKQAEALAARRATELEASNRELEAFSYSVSHDLRAPLRSIDGFSLALLEDCGAKLDQTGQEYLQRIRRAAQRMGQLIDDMLCLARVTRSDMRYAKLDLSALATEVAATLDRPPAAQDLAIQVQPNLFAYGDPALLRVAVENLLGNAIKFTGKTPRPRITLGAEKIDGRLVYVVRDNGAGFDMAYADKLFGAFQRLHREEEFPGTGIGLATVKRIIRRHGGEVWSESAVGKGAAFFFTLPDSQLVDAVYPLNNATV